MVVSRVQMYGHLLFLGGGSEAHLGLAVEYPRDDVFNPPPEPDARPQADLCVCNHHPTFLIRSAAGLHPVPVRGGEIVLRRGAYHLELAKDQLPWSHLVTHHMYFFACKWRILSKFSEKPHLMWKFNF